MSKHYFAIANYRKTIFFELLRKILLAGQKGLIRENESARLDFLELCLGDTVDREWICECFGTGRNDQSVNFPRDAMRLEYINESIINPFDRRTVMRSKFENCFASVQHPSMEFLNRGMLTLWIRWPKKMPRFTRRMQVNATAAAVCLIGNVFNSNVWLLELLGRFTSFHFTRTIDSGTRARCRSKIYGRPSPESRILARDMSVNIKTVGIIFINEDVRLLVSGIHKRISVPAN